jgi:hypothetical protein
MSAACEQVLICSCCVNLTGCVLRADSARQVLECDEYSTRQNSGGNPTATFQYAAPPESATDGLCIACRDRIGCSAHASGGPAWQCEEYR